MSGQRLSEAVSLVKWVFRSWVRPAGAPSHREQKPRRVKVVKARGASARERST